MAAKSKLSNRGAGRIGVLLPASNTNLEPDCALLLPQDVSAHFTRFGNYDVATVPDGAAMASLAQVSLQEPIDLLCAARVQVIAYACASATLACGWVFDRKLCREIATLAGVPVVTTSGAMVAAVQAVGATHIGFASPYTSALNAQAVAFFASAGIQVVKTATAAEGLTSADQGALTPRDAFAVGCAADHSEADVIVIGCTDFRAVEAVEDLQVELSKPVIVANQALIESCLQVLHCQKRPLENKE